MKNFVKSTLVASALVAGLAMPAFAQTQQCGVVVFFPSGQNALGPSARSAIEAFARANPDAQFTVTGFSDASGSSAANLTLSESRAQSVSSAMTAASVTTVAGAGEATRPGTTGPADPANRRVEVVNNACPGGLYGTQLVTTQADPFAPNAGVAIAAGVGALALGAILINNDDDNSGGSGGTGGTGGTN